MDFLLLRPDRFLKPVWSYILLSRVIRSFFSYRNIKEIFSHISKIKLLSEKIISKDDVENYYELRKNTLFLKISFTFEDKWKIKDYDFEYKIE